MPNKFVRFVFFLIFFHFFLLMFFYFVFMIGSERSKLTRLCTHACTQKYTHPPKKNKTREKTHALSLNWNTHNLNNKMATCTANTLSLTHTHTTTKLNAKEKKRNRRENESDHNQSNWPFDLELKPHLQNVLSTVYEPKKNEIEGATKKVRKKLFSRLYSQGADGFFSSLHSINVFSLMIFSIFSHKQTYFPCTGFPSVLKSVFFWCM